MNFSTDNTLNITRDMPYVRKLFIYAIDQTNAYESGHFRRATKSVRQLCCLEGRNATETKLSFVVNITRRHLIFFRLLVSHNRHERET